jgi:valyl-tRNA synthetase
VTVVGMMPFAVADERLEVLPGAVDIAAAPTDEREQDLYEQFVRVRAWDDNVRAGWMPVAYGRKRMIAPMD